MPGMYTCDNGQCINFELVCNGYNDCTTGDDENSCGTCAPRVPLFVPQPQPGVPQSRLGGIPRVSPQAGPLAGLGYPRRKDMGPEAGKGSETRHRGNPILLSVDRQTK